MRRDLAFTGVARQVERPARSIACLAFVAILVWGGCEETVSGTDIELSYRREVVV